VKPEYPSGLPDRSLPDRSLPDRLRAFAGEVGWNEDLWHEAAGEIERLRKQVAEHKRELSVIARIASEGLS
jgi:hypothetical protein